MSALRPDDTLTADIGRDYAALAGRPSPPVDVTFYPYRGLHHTLRERDGRLIFRFSDLLVDAPPPVVRTAARLLIARLLKQPAAGKDRQRYKDFVSQPDFRRRLRRLRRRRGRKEYAPAAGAVHDLREVFDQLNREHFGERVRVSLLGWSLRRSRRILGHYDRAHEAIIINRRLDAPLVPEYVVRYVVFHEMLHALLGEEGCGGRRKVHHKRFRDAERTCPDYVRARRFISANL